MMPRRAGDQMAYGCGVAYGLGRSRRGKLVVQLVPPLDTGDDMVSFAVVTVVTLANGMAEAMVFPSDGSWEVTDFFELACSVDGEATEAFVLHTMGYALVDQLSDPS